MLTLALAAVVALSSTVLIVRGADAAQPAAAPAAKAAAQQAVATLPSTGRPTVAPVPLLTEQRTTVLDQQVAYPTELPAEVSSSIITLVPGQSTGMHRHDAPLYAYILSGTLTVTYDGGVTKVYKPGTALLEAVGTAHNGTNRGTVPVRILVVNMGADGVANTTKL